MKRHGAAGGDHRLRRDAVPQVGGAADDVALDEGDLGAEAGRVGGRLVAGGPAADDHEALRHHFEATGRCSKDRTKPSNGVTCTRTT